MATNTIKARHISAAHTLAEWLTVTTIPLKGEACYELDGDDIPVRMKVGDGKRAYKDLPYIGTEVEADDDDKWIDVVRAGDRSKYTISHVGPDTTSTSDASTSGDVASFANATNIVTGVKIDSKGHVTGVTKENATNVVTSTGTLTNNQFALGGGSKTVKASGWTRSTTVNSSSTDSQIPTAKSVYDAINSALSAALTYKGTVAKAADLPTTGNKTGDVYIASAAFGDYETGDMFIWNGTGWDVVNGENQVTVQNTTMNFGGERNIGNVDGTQLKVTMPTITNPNASLSTIETIKAITQDTATGSVSVTKQTIRTGSTSQTGVLQLIDTYTTSNNTDNTKATTNKAIKAAIETLDVSSVGGSGKYISAISETDGIISATASSLSDVIGSGVLQVVANSGTTGIATPFNANSTSNTIGLNFINGNATTAVVTAVSGGAPTIKFNHNDTSSQDSIAAANKTFITGVTLDTYGHVTALTTGAISGTSPVSVSSSTSPVISLANAYGDTKNPYGTKAANLVLAGPSSGSDAAPTFRKLTLADLPSDLYGYGKIAVAAQSTGTSAVSGTAAVTLASTTANETVKLATGNKWIQIAATNGTAGNDSLTIGHQLSGVTALGTAGFKKVAYDAAGHITATSDVTTSDIAGKDDNAITITTTGATSTSSNNAKLTVTDKDFGVTKTSSLTGPSIYTSLLTDDANVTLIIDGGYWAATT